MQKIWNPTTEAKSFNRMVANSSVKSTRNWWAIGKKVIFYASCGLILLSVFRITLIGQALDDIFHRLLFGWMKYLYFFGLSMGFLIVVRRNNLISKYWKRFSKPKLIWSLINLFWLLGLISFLIINNESLNYSKYRLDKVIDKYVTEKWYKSTIFYKGIESVGQFFSWNGVFSSSTDGGGLIGAIIGGFSTFLHIIGGFILNFLSWSFLTMYLLFNHPFFIFLSKEKQRKYRWTNFNKKKNLFFQPSVISKIDQDEVTIQVPIEKKVDQQQTTAPKKEVWELDDT